MRIIPWMRQPKHDAAFVISPNKVYLNDDPRLGLTYLNHYWNIDQEQIMETLPLNGIL